MAEYTYALSTADLLPVKNNTPFGYYDNDPVFVNDAQRACFYVARRLGYGTVDVELVDFQIYAAYEEAVTTYGNEVYLYKIRENYLSLEGSKTEPFLCDYNITYFTAPTDFSPPTQSNFADFNNDPNMAMQLSGSIYYTVSASIFPSMSRADLSRVSSMNIEGQCGNFLPQYTYIKGSNVYFIVKDPRPFIDVFGDYVQVNYVDGNYIMTGTPEGNKYHNINFIKYKSDYNMNTRIVDRSLGGVIRTAQNYADQVFIGKIPVYSASIDLQDNVQKYDLKVLSQNPGWAVSGSRDNVVVTRVFYEPTPAIAMYNNPFPGLGGVSAYPDGWGIYSGFSGNNFIVWPVYFDLQRMQEIEMSQQVRSSGFSFAINDNVLQVFPIPSGGGRLWIEYAKESDVLAQNQNLNSNAEPYGQPVVTDISNVPYSNPVYSNINSVGKSWIMRYTLALAKEILGFARGKYPGADVPKIGAMSSSDLMSQSQADKIALLEQLRDVLDMTSKQKQLERQKSELDSQNEILKSIPLPQQIYIL